MAQLETEVFEAIAERALGEWDIGVTRVELVSVSDNIIFRVDTDTNQSYALNIHCANYHSRAELVAEQQWTAALNKFGIRAPIPKMTRKGSGFSKVSMPDCDEARHVGLVKWITGEMLASVLKEETDDVLAKHHFGQLGRLAARMHNQAVDWWMPADFHRPAWDAEGLLGETPIWGIFWQAPELTVAERDHLLDARGTLLQWLLDYGITRANYSFIHADLHPENVLVYGEKISLIDFDDAGFGWHLYDLAVALYYDQDKAHFETARAALIRGYRCERSLDDTVDELLSKFLLIRALVLLGWLHGRGCPGDRDNNRIRKVIQQACTQAEGL